MAAISLDGATGANFRQMGTHIVLHALVDFPADFGDREAMPRQADNSRCPHDAENCADGTVGQVAAAAAPRFVIVEFIHQRHVTNRLSPRKEEPQDPG